jgi:hypothetical protein
MTFAPGPYTTLEIGSHAGFHSYIVDRNGRKIGVAWGPHAEKVWTAALFAASLELFEYVKSSASAGCATAKTLIDKIEGEDSAHATGKCDG